MARDTRVVLHLSLAEVLDTNTSGGRRTLGSTRQDAEGGGRARAKPQPKNSGEELAAAAPRGRASARAVSVEEEEVRVVARALVAALASGCMCAVARASDVLDARDLETCVLAREEAAPDPRGDAAGRQAPSTER